MSKYNKEFKLSVIREREQGASFHSIEKSIISIWVLYADGSSRTQSMVKLPWKRRTVTYAFIPLVLRKKSLKLILREKAPVWISLSDSVSMHKALLLNG